MIDKIDIPAQIGILIDFPPYIGTLVIGIGFWFLILWLVIFNIIPSVIYTNRVGIFTEVLISISFVFGLFLMMIGILFRYNVFWQFTIILFIVGRLIEGAIFIRVIRKILFYSSKIINVFRPSRSSGLPSQKLFHAVFWKIIYQTVTFTFIFLSVSVIGWTAAAVSDAPLYPFPIIFATYISTLGVFVFIWDFRAIIGGIDTLPLTGVIFCIVGAEIYNFPAVDVPISFFQNLRILLQHLLPFSIELGKLLSAIDLMLLFVGQVSFFIGAGLALLFLYRIRKC